MLKITREGRKGIYLIIQTSLHFSTSCIKLHTVPEKYDFDSLLWIRDNALHQNLLLKKHRYKVRTTGYQVNLVSFSVCGFNLLIMHLAFVFTYSMIPTGTTTKTQTSNRFLEPSCQYIADRCYFVTGVTKSMWIFLLLLLKKLHYLITPFLTLSCYCLCLDVTATLMMSCSPLSS